MIAEFFAGDLFHFLDVFHDLSHDLIVDFLTVLIVLGAGFRRDGEALRNRKTEICHFSKVCAFTAEKLAHVRVAFGKKVDVFFCHCCFTSEIFWFLWIKFETKPFRYDIITQTFGNIYTFYKNFIKNTKKYTNRKRR